MLRDYTSTGTLGTKQVERTAIKWHKQLIGVHRTQDHLDTYTQQKIRGLTNLKTGPPGWLDTHGKAIWQHQMQLTLRKCIECIQLPAQRRQLRDLWRDLEQTTINSKNSNELVEVSAAMTRGINKRPTTRSMGRKSRNNDKQTQLPPPPPLLPLPPPPPSAVKLDNSDIAATQCSQSEIEEPPFHELPRGEDFTPLRNPFEINRAIKPTTDIAKILAMGIFGSTKKALFLYYSIYKYMLWYEPRQKKDFKPTTTTTLKGTKVFVNNWGEWKELVRKKKCMLNREQMTLIASLYQLQIRFFEYKGKEGGGFICTGQTDYLHHRVINVLGLADSKWTLLQGTTLPVLRYDPIIGKYDVDYYLGGSQLDKGYNKRNNHRGGVEDRTIAAPEGHTTAAHKTIHRQPTTQSGATLSHLPTTPPIQRELETAGGSSLEGTMGEERQAEVDSLIQSLFPEELVIEQPKKVRINKRQVWQRWRNLVRTKNKEANRKYIIAISQEKKKEDSRKMVFDYTTGKLTDSEVDILSKGETFCPATHTIDVDRLKTDIYNYNRRLRLHEQFRDRKPQQATGIRRSEETTGTVSRISRRLSRDSANRTSRHISVPTQNNNTSVKHRKLPSTYDPLTQNRNLNRYTTCIQEDCLLAIKTEVRTKDNIHKRHRLALKSLRNKVDNRQIMITKADKGSGIVVCDYDIYIQKGTRYIEEEAGAYNKVEDVEAELVTRLTRHRNKIVEQLRKESVIPLQTATFCTKQLEEKVTGMKFYFKIHKDQNIATTPLRPLQSCISAPTHHLSLVLTDILQPLLTTKNIPSFIFDSNHLLFRLQTLGTIPSNCTLVSSDVSALYPSIPHEQGLEATQQFLRTNTHYNEPQITALTQALKLVISENYVMWNNNIYKQTSGVAMGTPVAVAYANIFMAWVDSRVKQQANYIHEHIRFIDDNLFIIPETDIDHLMHIANSILPSIKYTHEKLDRTSDKGLAFLDTQLFISEDNRIEARLYTKPTDRHAYLLPSSYHPPHIVRNIPSAVFKRLRRICSRPQWFLEDAEQAKEWLTNRGYKKSEVNRALQQTERLDRWDMIVKIETNRGLTKTRTEDIHTIPFIVTYNKHATTLKQALARRQDLLNSSFKHTRVKPRVTFRRQKNLNDLLIQKALRGPIRQIDEMEKGFVACGEKQQYRGVCPCKQNHEKYLCRCCAHASFQPFDSKVKLRKKLDCNSKNLVYLIGCRKCDKTYIGETQQTLRDRLMQHLNNIAKFNQPLYLHFRSVHPPDSLFVTILESVRSTEQFFRKVREAWWINHLQTLEPKGLNVKLDCNQTYQEDIRQVAIGT